MTRGGGSGSRRGRGSRDPGAVRRGWAPLAPPCEAPTRPGTRPPRRSRAGLRRVAAAAAAAMSPGKPGAGGAGTRRTGGRRRRRRRRLEAVTQAPGLGRTAGPGSRVPGTFQGARGMKPAAREARPPPRSPGLRWALPPLLLLLRLGQVSRRVVGAGAGVVVAGAGGREEGGAPGLEAPAPARARPDCGIGADGRGGVGGLRVPGALPSWRPASRAGDPALSPAPASPKEGGGLGGPGWGDPEPRRGRPPRGLQAVSGPAQPRAGHIWRARARLARPERPEGACLRGAPTAEPGRPGGAAADLRPGLRGPRGGAEGPRPAGSPGRGRGRGGWWARRGASGPRALLLGKVAAPGEGGFSQACLRATVLLPEKLPAFPGCLIRALWAPAFPTPPPSPPPRALFSSFAFQIMRCLAFWRSIPLKSAVSPSWCSHRVRQGSRAMSPFHR